MGYQVQLDTDLYPRIKALQDYRDNKVKLFKGEVINNVLLVYVISLANFFCMLCRIA